MSNLTKRYRGFISYSQSDKPYAKRLHQALERYRIPAGVRLPDGGSGNTRRLGRFFRDDEEMGAATDLGAALQGAIADSESLIVVCSPRAAQSPWVDAEVVHFKRTGRADRIFAVIVGGAPNTGDPDTECFPPALRFVVNEDGALTDQPTEPLGIDFRKESFARLRTRLAAGLLDIPFDSMWRRDRRRARARTTTAALAAAIGVAAVTSVFDSLAARQLRSDMAVLADRLLDEGEVRAASALAVGALSTQTDILALLSIGEDEATRNIAETTLREAGLHLDPVVNLGAPNTVSSFHTAPDRSAVFVSALMGGGVMWRADDWSQSHTADWRFVDYAPDAEAYLLQGGQIGETPALKRTTDGELIARYGDDSYEEFEFSADGRWMAYAFRGTAATLVDVRTGDRIMELNDGPMRLDDSRDGFEFLADNSALILRFRDDTAAMVSLDTGQRHALPSNADIVASPNGSRIATLDAAGELVLWDSNTGEVVMRRANFGGYGRLVFSPDGRTLIAIALSSDTQYASGRGFTVIDAQTGQMRFRALSSVRWSSVEITETGDAAVFSSSGEAALFDLRTFVFTQELDDLRTPYTHSLSPDGRRVVFFHGAQGGLLYDTDTSRRLAVLAPPDQSKQRVPETVTWSPDNAHLAVRFSGTGNDKLGGVWRSDDGSFIAATGDEGSMFWGAFSPDGSRFAPSSGDAAGQIIALPSGEVLSTADPLDLTGPVIFSADSRYLLASTSDFMADGVTRVWDAQTGETVLHIDRTRDAEFAPNSEQLLVQFRDYSGAVLNIPSSQTGEVSASALRTQACALSRDRIPALTDISGSPDVATQTLFARLSRRPEHACNWHGLLSADGWRQWAGRLAGSLRH